MAVLTLTLADAAALRAVFDQQLSKKRAFLVGSGGVCERESCELSIELGARSFRVTGEVVYVKAEEPGRGVGLSLGGIDEARMAALAAFVAECEAACGAPGAAGEGAGEDAEGTEGEEAAEEEEGEGAQAPLRMHERIRSLSGIEQQKLAATGSLAERTALERMYGPNVWETLLRNPRLTIPEVARIARKGTLPRPLVEAIGANAAWVAAGEVQRALLSNPRSSAAVVSKILHAMPRSELHRVTQQTAYPMTVRSAAKKMLGGGE